MDSGFYAACAGLRAQSQALDVAAHNVANVSTTGFRGQQASFQTLLALARPAASNPLNLTINNFGVLEGSKSRFERWQFASHRQPARLGHRRQRVFRNSNSARHPLHP